MHARPIQPPRRGRRPRLRHGVVAALALFALGSVLALEGQATNGNPPTALVGGSSRATSTGTPVGSDRAGIEASSSPVASPGATQSIAGSGGAALSPGLFPGGLLIADRANGRLLVVDSRGSVLWHFPSTAGLPRGQRFNADDAFLAPDGRTIVANDEFHEVIDRIDIATGRIVWQYGHYGRKGAGRGFLHTPDDAYPLANGDVVVADIENCRILQIAPDHTIRRQWGRSGDCRDAPPRAFARPNGDTPMPDGGLLVTEITGSRVVRLAADGHVVFDIHVPVAYPSDAQLDANGNVVVADFSSRGQVVDVNPSTGAVVWRWSYSSGSRRLDHPSLATPLPGGLVSVNDDFRHRMVVIDPAAGRIVWQYGHTDVARRSAGYLNTPDGHQPLPATGPF